MKLLFWRDKEGFPWLSITTPLEAEREEVLFLYNSLPMPPKIDGKRDYGRLPKLHFVDGVWKIELPLHGDSPKAGKP